MMIISLASVIIALVLFFEKNIFLNKAFFSLNRNVNPLLRVEKINGYYGIIH